MPDEGPQPAPVTDSRSAAISEPESSVPTVEVTGSEAQAAPRRSRSGVWAFALSLLGLTLLPIIGSVLGFVLGRVAIRKADAAPVVGGRGLAIAAVTISVVTLVVIALGIAAYSLLVAFVGI